MKLYSPRTWLVIAAAGLLLAGAVVLVVVKVVGPPLPPLPQGWTVHEDRHYRVALPPGERDDDLCKIAVKVGRNRTVIVAWEESSWVKDLEGLEERVDLFENAVNARVTERERIRVRGFPAIRFTNEPINVSDPAPRSKVLMVLTKDHLFTLIAFPIRGTFEEEDAELFFRSFRPK